MAGGLGAPGGGGGFRGGGGGGGIAGPGGGCNGGLGGGDGSPLKMTLTPVPRKVVMVLGASLAVGRTDTIRKQSATQKTTARTPLALRLWWVGVARSLGCCCSWAAEADVGSIRARVENEFGVRRCSSSSSIVTSPIWARPVLMGELGSATCAR
jgi:hypothetical protein